MNNDNMEIERKYLVETCPFSLHDYPSHEIEQGYLTQSRLSASGVTMTAMC